MEVKWGTAANPRKTPSHGPEFSARKKSDISQTNFLTNLPAHRKSVAGIKSSTHKSIQTHKQFIPKKSTL
jgi:hypothetical protein